MLPTLVVTVVEQLRDEALKLICKTSDSTVLTGHSDMLLVVVISTLT